MLVMPDVMVTETMAADPTSVYALVSDVTRMGRWSPETRSCRWLGNATGPVEGARFRGTNRHGLLRWSTTCTVTAARSGRRFAFDVDFHGVPIAQWAYDFAPTADGCQVTESWSDRRPAWMRMAAIPTTGVADRASHNRRGMQATLAALRRAAETSGP